ncbi:hypothetical protein F8388_020285 [Cannabis sativa]|uniref:Helicase/UvrB N-terminal domain-containing protein n=1 Tax=Cannabis sativa TaxID=3483 RepID=A0A7J6FVJ4_CANSA|nr:hypothetical protein F8388_020285 [Cannabis sativa]
MFRLKLIEIKLLFSFHTAVFAIKSSDIAIAGSVVNFQEVNVPLRDYQLDITKKALFSNTLVALPTGLGKTLIAAVVMYNYFRWFPDGNEWTIDMTGQISPTNRACLWKSKRVFFVTPQVLEKDIQSDISVKQLFSFREAQFLYRLSDEHVADLFREHTRKLIEKHISSARTLLKSKTRATYTLLNT